MSFKNFKQKISKEEKKKLYKIKKLKKNKLNRKKNNRYKKKLAKKYFEYPSTVPITSKVSFKDKEEFEEKNGLRIPIKIPLTQLGDQLIEKNIHEYRYYRKTRRGERTKSNTSITTTITTTTTNNVNNIELSSVSSSSKRLNVPIISIIDYNTLHKKIDSITSLQISDVPKILFSVSELIKRFDIQHPIKIQYVSINGFFTVEGQKTPQLLGGELLFMIDKISKVGGRQQQQQQQQQPLQRLTNMPPSEKIFHHQMLQYNKDNNFLTINSSKLYNNIFFKKNFHVNKDTIMTISFLPIPLFARQVNPLGFNGSIMIVFKYIKKK